MDPWASFILYKLSKRHYGENEMKRNTRGDNISNQSNKGITSQNIQGALQLTNKEAVDSLLAPQGHRLRRDPS